MNKCGSKRVYYSRNKAWKQAKREALRVGHSMYFYQCEHCGWWHLTHTDPRVWRRQQHYRSVIAKM